jgi:hypothetical protein
MVLTLGSRAPGIYREGEDCIARGCDRARHLADCESDRVWRSQVNFADFVKALGLIQATHDAPVRSASVTYGALPIHICVEYESGAIDYFDLQGNQAIAT